LAALVRTDKSVIGGQMCGYDPGFGVKILAIPAAAAGRFFPPLPAFATPQVQ
jgi:hypothetical protein